MESDLSQTIDHDAEIKLIDQELKGENRELFVFEEPLTLKKVLA